TDEKHICLDLTELAGRPLAQFFSVRRDEAEAALGVALAPELTRWIECLEKSPVTGRPGQYRPLVLDGRRRLYLYRYWNYEQQLAAAIRTRLSSDNATCNRELLRTGLQRYFANPGTVPDWQKVAAFAALTNKFCVISGGPGTGKTFTVTNILALMIEQRVNANIRLCAPTGKAVARLQESLVQALPKLPCTEEIRSKIPREPSTIHRLLGSVPGSSVFRYNRTNPLAADVVIVDEASMIPLALMAKLCQALPEQATLILLGDKDQLASVEAGAVLADICAASEVRRFSNGFCRAYSAAAGEELPTEFVSTRSDTLVDSAVELQFSYRFAAAPSIGHLSLAVNAGDTAAAAELLSDPDGQEVTCRPLYSGRPSEAVLPDSVMEGYLPYLRAACVQDAYRSFETFRILCALRRGYYGVDELNTAIERLLQHAGMISPAARFYHGRPIMITSNNYRLKLFNGDIGLLWASADNEVRAWFPDAAGAFRNFVPARLPAHETAYALTVHKSQGSEFNRVVLVLPDRISAVLTRELIYTGITRAKERIEIWSNEAAFCSMVQARVARSSGLKEALMANIDDATLSK
ncbi:MAG: exodeoxyribonuclease V subunit alpha, partial [Deltaproteobacteria bacterium]|nr:exodeoxyribonuclease V subunit alpha [Deltaproteobacteria bacterium]